MARAAVRRRLTWELASVIGVIDQTPRVRTIELELPGWPSHEPGQHVDVRLTAEDGYSTERSYSIATAPNGSKFALTVERLDDGEVSPYLAGELRPGDQLELRGPIGGFFVWLPDRGGPLQLIAGGSGLVPVMAMLRTRIATDSNVQVRLLLSSRTWADVIYRTELESIAASEQGIGITHTLTRTQPPGWTGHDRRVDAQLLADQVWPANQAPLCYVCGPSGFVENVASALVELGHAPDRIRTERFGPTGGSR